MKTLTFFILTLLIITPLYSQSSIIFEAGTHIEVQNGANISAGYVSILGTYSGGGTVNGLPIPVEFISFSASVSKKTVTLNWETATETNNMGFEVQRLAVSDQQTSASLSTGSVWEVVGFVQGAGTSTEKHDYTFTDKSSLKGKYFYRLKQSDFDGQFSYSDEIEVEIGLPTEFELSQNYPNPFNPETVISYQLPVSGNVSLKVFDMLGREVVTLVDEVKEAGAYDVTFNGKALASGTYIYRLQSGDYIKIHKMILLK